MPGMECWQELGKGNKATVLQRDTGLYPWWLHPPPKLVRPAILICQDDAGFSAQRPQSWETPQFLVNQDIGPLSQNSRVHCPKWAHRLCQIILFILVTGPKVDTIPEGPWNGWQP